MNVLITGSTGMIGSAILKLCLQSDRISDITTLIRKSQSYDQEKLKSVAIKDYKNYDNRKELFQHVDIVFFCLGAYTGQVPNDLFKEITVDYAVNCAKHVREHSPNARFCLLSGAGADRTEKSKTSFAKFKGMAENQIVQTGIEFYAFRPGYIYPVEPRQEPNVAYRLMRIMYPVIKLFGDNASVKSDDLASAMFNVGLNGADQEILENRDISRYV